MMVALADRRVVVADASDVLPHVCARSCARCARSCARSSENRLVRHI